MKRLLSIFTLCATLLCAVCPSVCAEDTISYPNTTTVVYKEDFENYEGSLSHYTSEANTSYSSVSTLPGGKGDNTSAVGVYYDYATTGTATARVTDDGSVDPQAKQVGGKPLEYMYVNLTEEFSAAEHIRVEFKYYNAKNAIKYKTQPTEDNPAGVLSTTIRDTVTFALKDNLTSDNTNNAGRYRLNVGIQNRVLIPQSWAGGTAGVTTKQLQDYAAPATWQTVILDAYIERGAAAGGLNKVTYTVQGNGKTSEEFVVNGAKEFKYFTLNFSDYGGKFYLDDLKISVIEDFPESLKAAAENLTFADISAGTNNTQDNVYESWEDGFLSELTEDGDTYRVEWSSSNEGAIAPDGTVTQTAYEKRVNLTAKIIYTDTVYAQKTFPVTVTKLVGATPAQTLEQFAADFITEKRLSDEVTDTSNLITKDLKNLIDGDTTAGIGVTWQSSDTEYLSHAGKVTRPWYAVGDKVVELDATLTLAGAEDKTVTLTFTVGCLPEPQGVVDEAIAAISITAEDTNKITKKLNLLTEHGFAKISWASSNESVIDTAGKVTRGDAEQTVTLTATAEFCDKSKSQDYTVTVLPTTEKMIEADIKLVSTAGWDALTDDITLPLTGAKYGSEFSWSATSDYFVIDSEDSATAAYVDVKRPPHTESGGNETVVLSLRATNKAYGADSVTRSFNVTVLCQESDLALAQKGAAMLNFDYIKDDADTKDAVVHNLSLPTGFDFDADVKVAWKSSNENLVTDAGEVIRPYGTTGSTEVTMTAVVSKNYSSADPVLITFTVKPFDTAGELLEAAKSALTFSVISDEAIDAVTKNLSLVTDWKYNTTIEWTSKSSLIAVNGAVGEVTRPEWGQTASPSVLVARITYPATSQSVEKEFSVSVLEKDYMETYDNIVFEDFDEWVDAASSFATQDGTWTTNSADEADSYYSHLYEDDNHVLCIDKTQDTPVNGYLFMAHDTMEVFGVYEFKFFIPNENQSSANSITIMSNSAQIPIVLNAKDGVISSNMYVSTSAAAMKFADGTFEKDRWNTLRIEGDVAKKRYHLYLNGTCITQNGTVTIAASGEAVDTIEGVPFYYYNDSTRTADLKKVRFYTDKYKYYIDDLSVRQKLVYTDAQKNTADEWDRAFRGANDLSDIKKNLVIPDVAYSGISISYESDNTRVIDEYGNVSDVTEPTAVAFTAVFDNQVTKYKRTYNLTVTRGLTYSTPKTDADCVKSDLAAAKEYLQKNYNLNNLTSSINVSALQGANGSSVTISSSNTESLSNSGAVTLGSGAVSLTLTITAQKGAQSKSDTLAVTVGKKSEPSTDGGGGGGGGFKVSYGANTVSKVNIEEETNEDKQTDSEFKDVSRDHWAYTPISYLTEKGIMQGTGNGEIEPERAIKREEFIKMLVIAMGGAPSNALCGFADADEDAWYAPYLAAAKRLGIVQGFADGTVGIGQSISRQDMATMIYRATALAATKGEQAFADDESISDYAAEAVYTLKESGIINGNEALEFAPNASATRAETAAMLYRAIQQNIFETER